MQDTAHQFLSKSVKYCRSYDEKNMGALFMLHSEKKMTTTRTKTTITKSDSAYKAMTSSMSVELKHHHMNDRTISVGINDRFLDGVY